MAEGRYQSVKCEHFFVVAQTFVFTAFVLPQTDSQPSSAAHLSARWPPLSKQPVLSCHPGAFPFNKNPINGEWVLLSHGGDVIRFECFISC